jgi:DNA-binding MarR family transcriptional regulator
LTSTAVRRILHPAMALRDPAQLIHLLVQVHDRLEAWDEQQKKYLEAHETTAVSEVTQKLTVPALHVLDEIDQQGPLNGATLAKTLGFTKGGISKILSRLRGLGLVETSRLPDNRKELVASATGTGSQVAQAHRRLHDQLLVQGADFLHRYSDAELTLVIAFLSDLIRNSPFSVKEAETGEGPPAAG